MSGLACTKKETVVEDASELNLGKEFEDAACLSLAEVRLIQQSKMDDDRENGDETNTTQTRCARVSRGAGEKITWLADFRSFFLAARLPSELLPCRGRLARLRSGPCATRCPRRRL